MVKKWKLLEAKEVFVSPFLKVFQDRLEKPDGKIVENFFSIQRKDAACIVALTKDKKIPLVRQYKNGVKDLIWEIPAGFIDDGESPEEAAKRELLEETGFSAEKFHLLTSVAITSGTSATKNYLFLATQAEKVSEQKLDENEDIEVELYDFDELVEKVKERNSFFVDVNSQLTLLLSDEALKR